MCGVFLGAALWFGAPSLVAGQHPTCRNTATDAEQVCNDPDSLLTADNRICPAVCLPVRALDFPSSSVAAT